MAMAAKLARIFLTLLVLSATGLILGLNAARPLPTVNLPHPSFLTAQGEVIVGSAAAAATTNTSAVTWQAIQIKSGDKLSSIFKRLGIDLGQLSSIMDLGGDTLALARLHPGDILKVKVGAEGRLEELLYDIAPTRTLHVQGTSPAAEDFQARTVEYPLERRVSRATGTIDSSLISAGHRIGLSTGLVMTLASVFGYDIDFALDLRKGDSFSVLYEEFYARGQKVRDGDVLAAEFTNQDKTYQAVRYADGTGNANYYTPDGHSLRKAFLRTPVEFSHISSTFSLARLHPILNHIRAHKGVDYAAPVGTPVKATADGTVDFSGVKSGYGNLILLQHGHTYSTVYAHLSRFAQGVRAGTRVRQGQVIGYVGQTGLATGPHLHYEFRINDEFRDPLKVALPTAQPLGGRELRTFTQQARDLFAQLRNSTGLQQAASRANPITAR